jgi:hypothetical protein
MSRADRVRQRQLDACLTLLEEAHERDEQLVSAALSTRLGQVVPGVVTGMRIAEALELVFQAQEDCLHTDAMPAQAAAGPGGSVKGDRGLAGVEPLDRDGARALTERIKTAANKFSLLLLEAHERQACLALGYRTWEQYVRHEFGLSRTRSYELLDHGRLIRRIQSTTGVTAVADIPPYTARKVKPYMSQFIDALKSRMTGRSEEEMPSIIHDVIRDHRALAHPSMRVLRDDGGSARSAAGPGEEKPGEGSVWTAIECLAAMPPVGTVIDDLLDGTPVHLGAVERALGWLTRFAAETRARQRPGMSMRAGPIEPGPAEDAEPSRTRAAVG